jgi:hypothetical protein
MLFVIMVITLYICFGLLVKRCQHPVTIFVWFGEKNDVHLIIILPKNEGLH